MTPNAGLTIYDTEDDCRAAIVTFVADYLDRENQTPKMMVIARGTGLSFAITKRLVRDLIRDGYLSRGYSLRSKQLLVAREYQAREWI